MDATFELGLYTFGDLMPEAKTGKAVGAQQRLAEILAAAKLADVSGLDVFAVGQHHRLDMAIAATPVVLAAIAAVTERTAAATYRFPAGGGTRSSSRFIRVPRVSNTARDNWTPTGPLSVTSVKTAMPSGSIPASMSRAT